MILPFSHKKFGFTRWLVVILFIALLYYYWKFKKTEG